MDSHMIRSTGTSLSVSALFIVLSACGTAVEVGDFEDGSGGATSSGVGPGGNDAGVTSSGTSNPTSGSGGGDTSTTAVSSGNGGGDTSTTAVSSGNGGGGGGVECGGFTGDTCAEDEFCDFEHPGCDFADAQGICAPRPQACPFDVVIPVCACDGEVYQSECWAQLAGSDTSSDEACGSLSPCGGKSGLSCGDDEYCDFAGELCGANDEQGLCRTRPTECPSGGDQPLPCACDGEAYWTACEAARNGADVWGGADLCEPVMCGGIGGMECPGDDQFCDYPNDSFCGGDDSLGVCRSRPTECPEPNADEAVCGCDQDTYGSECLANLVGMDTLPGDALECGGA